MGDCAGRLCTASSGLPVSLQAAGAAPSLTQTSHILPARMRVVGLAVCDRENSSEPIPRSRCILGASLEDAQMKILVHLSYQVRYLIAAVGAGFLLASATLAQSTFGSITGVVTDGSGGVTPGAEVSVTNSGTGAARKLTTGATGVFNVPNLDLGTYVLRVSAKGFSTYERTGLNLESNQVLNVNVELTVGSISSVVEVHAPSPTITTETNDLSGSVGSAAVEHLPMVSRHTGDGGIYAYTLL